ncbi:methyltransferase family protein [Geotalea toluenoxydans]
MSDMTGYNVRERFFTIGASVAPYPFMVVAVWTPFTSLKPALCAGMVLYLIGLGFLVATLYVLAATPLDQPFSAGPYKVSRNPLYLAATLLFFSICVVSLNVILFAITAILVVLQHLMILAEERVCRLRYGRTYEEYMKKVPRYLWCN